MEILKNVVSDAREHSSALYDIEILNGYVKTIHPVAAASPDTDMPPPQLLLPPLCHPHIHLDKAYILTCNHPHPDYSDLCPVTGSFGEALLKTSQAKERYTPEDLYSRGSQLLATSYTQGVTSMRVFVEVDHVTGNLPLTTATRLKRDFAHLLELQICIFAQDPILSTDHGDANRAILEDAIIELSHSIEVIGTTPYVEASGEASLSNIEWAIKTALKHSLHLDFHLDYTLESSSSRRPLTLSVIRLLEKYKWAQIADKSKTIVLGHCSQLSMLDDASLRELADTIIASKLPIHFIGLPTSDMFMMGRPSTDCIASQNRPRGTIHVPSMIRELGLSVALGVNNVGNAFTPFGTGDPLQLASWAVGIYQVGTVKDAQLLYDCVSTRARQAIGLGRDETWSKLHPGQNLRGMLRNPRSVELPCALGQSNMAIVPRPRLSLKDVVWDPPEICLRSIMR